MILIQTVIYEAEALRKLVCIGRAGIISPILETVMLYFSSLMF